MSMISIPEDSNLKSKIPIAKINILTYSWMNKFIGNEGSILNFARSYERYGLNIDKDGNIVYREWAPAARELSLVTFIIIKYYYSLVTSMAGIEILINAKKMSLE